MKKDELEQWRLREALTYDSETGHFTWNVLRPNAGIGTVAGSVGSTGYLIICLKNVRYCAHRLAWFYVHGVWPTRDIDHINHDRLDNRISNLRELSRRGNMQNQIRAHANNGTGALGVRPHGQRFVARIKIDGKQKHIGVFASVEAASKAYIQAKRKFHPAGTL